jgi:hypothetical protein
LLIFQELIREKECEKLHQLCSANILKFIEKKDPSMQPTLKMSLQNLPLENTEKA